MNTLSVFGRMSYGAHALSTALLVGSSYWVYTSSQASSKETQDAEMYDNLPKLKKVDPDLFNPFSAIPFHNNLELKYRYADMKLHGYLDPKSQLNTKDYAYKGFHDCYDHSGKKQHYYNWISVVPSHNA